MRSLNIFKTVNKGKYVEIAREIVLKNIDQGKYSVFLFGVHYNVTLDIILVADQVKDEYFLKNKPIKTGKTISFLAKRYSFTETIINILLK